MPVDLGRGDLIRQLRRAGLRPDKQLVQQILDQAHAVDASLLNLARAVDLLYKDEPECWGPVHALRLLGELRPVTMIEPLLSLLPLDLPETYEQPALRWVDELPQILARIGEPAVALLKAFADDTTREDTFRYMAVATLGYTAVAAPASRDEIVAWLRERLATTDDPIFAGHLAGMLAQLGVNDAYREIMDAFREGRIDRDVMTPATARQWLLSKGEKRLTCVAHPFWERYEQHGPFSKEQYKMMEQLANNYDEA